MNENAEACERITDGKTPTPFMLTAKRPMADKLAENEPIPDEVTAMRACTDMIGANAPTPDDAMAPLAGPEIEANVPVPEAA